MDSDSLQLATLPLVLPVRLLHLCRLVFFCVLPLSLHFLLLLLVLQPLLVPGHVRALFPFDISAGKTAALLSPPGMTLSSNVTGEALNDVKLSDVKICSWMVVSVDSHHNLSFFLKEIE
jgi:hypothetical protein